MRQGPARTCIGCRKIGPAGELALLLVSEDHVQVVPRGSRAASGAQGKRGRGAWIHPSCLEAALTNGAIKRAFRRQVEVPLRETLLAQMQVACGRSLNMQGNAR